MTKHVGITGNFVVDLEHLLFLSNRDGWTCSYIKERTQNSDGKRP
jgi:hypothetical protein